MEPVWLSLRPFTLLQMITNYACTFFHLGRWVSLLQVLSQSGPPHGKNAELLTQLPDLLEHVHELQLSFTEKQARLIQEKIRTGGPETVTSDDFLILADRLETELQNRQFLYVQRPDLYNADNPLSTNSAFPTGSLDAAEALKCQALGRPTAAVFHAVRIVEAGVRKLAERFGIEPARPDWTVIARDISRHVESLPRASEVERRRKERYSDVVAHSLAVKNAWRNPVTHPQAFYMIDEANKILDNVRAFVEAFGRLEAE